ncbi:hypothetical protein AVEN_9521-1 [Araneus ventricosus]|uniref:Uncharacterized protein n=1 Tax=Araneus ventricosus TaxID=182803 RepID=A0A4Y2DNY9_ARAVE|nr:hypothetical protein AVEN_9521-1 [Araneus ventricosus]
MHGDIQWNRVSNLELSCPEAVTLSLCPAYDHKSVGNTVPKLIRRSWQWCLIRSTSMQSQRKKSQTVRSGHILSHLKWLRRQQH